TIWKKETSSLYAARDSRSRTPSNGTVGWCTRQTAVMSSTRMSWSGSTDGRPCAAPTSLQGGDTMSAITKVTRRMSYEEILEGLGQRHQMILEALRERPRSTARELALFLWERK